jgi:AsmA protein
MIEKAAREDRAKDVAPEPISRWTLTAVIVCGLIVLAAGLAGAPLLFKDAALQSEIARQLRATTGLALSSAGPGRFVLLPRPHVAMDALHVADPTGTLTIDADALDGDVRLLPLIVGRIELASVTLSRPRLVIDLDGTPIRPDSLIGRAIRAEEPSRSDGRQRLGIVTLVDGSATIRSKAFPLAPKLEAINVTLDWRDLESPATLTGSLLVRETAADIAAWIAQPSSLMRGDHSAVAFHIHSKPIDLSATGDLASAGTTAFRGHMSAKAPSASALLAMFGDETSLIAPFANLSLTSDAAIGIDQQAQASVDLPNLTLHADGNEYEGTLAFQSGAVPLLSGTLATEQLTIAPFLEKMSAPVDAKGNWSTAPILERRPRLPNLDLRVSSSHIKLNQFTIDDAALAVMTRGDRTEVALVEGKAYGGAMRGRVSIGVPEDGGISLRGTGSLMEADASALTWDGFGRQIAAGALSASVNLETTGATVSELMNRLQGWARTSAADGEISDVDIGRGLRELRGDKPDTVLTALRGGRTPFQSLAFGAQVVDGVATFENSAIKGADAAIVVGGSADLGARHLDLHAVATPPTQGTAMVRTSSPSLRFDIDGSFAKPVVHARVKASTPPKDAR